MYRSLGWSRADCGKFLHVTERCLRNWEAGRNAIPYAAYRLLRIHCGYQLPGASWRGWSISRGKYFVLGIPRTDTGASSCASTGTVETTRPGLAPNRALLSKRSARAYFLCGGTSVQLPWAISAAMPMLSPSVGCG